MTTQTELAGRWNELKGKVKEKWGVLTDQELVQVEGNRDRLIGLVQRKTGESRAAIEQFVDELVEEGASVVQQVASTARDYAQAAGRQVGEVYDQAAETVRQGYEQAEEYVQHNPAQSVAIAFGAGVLAGLIVGLVLRAR